MRKQRKQENGVEIASRALPQPRDEAAQALALSHAPLLLELRHARQRRVALDQRARGRLRRRMQGLWRLLNVSLGMSSGENLPAVV